MAGDTARSGAPVRGLVELVRGELEDLYASGAPRACPPAVRAETIEQIVAILSRRATEMTTDEIVGLWTIFSPVPTPWPSRMFTFPIDLTYTVFRLTAAQCR